MLNSMLRSKVGVLIMCGLAALVPGQGQEPPPGKQELEVRLWAKKNIVQIGEPVRLVVEIRNQSRDVLFINRDITDIGDRFQLYLRHGTAIERSMSRAAGDFVIDRDTPYATLLVQHWVPLGPGNFYGGEVVMDTVAFPTLSTPGTYSVQGIYVSQGFNEPGMGNPLRGRESETARLPFRAWEGRIETNSISIEVAAAKKRGSGGQ